MYFYTQFLKDYVLVCSVPNGVCKQNGCHINLHDYGQIRCLPALHVTCLLLEVNIFVDKCLANILMFVVLNGRYCSPLNIIKELQ